MIRVERRPDLIRDQTRSGDGADADDGAGELHHQELARRPVVFRESHAIGKIVTR